MTIAYITILSHVTGLTIAAPLVGGVTEDARNSIIIIYSALLVVKSIFFLKLKKET